MTTEELRDHFAGQALAGLLAQHISHETDRGAESIDPRWRDYNLVAEGAYAIADAMLKARGY